MKNLLKLTLAVLFLMSGTSLFAQKFGRVNMQELVSVMPETQKMQLDLETLAKELEEALEGITVELQNKFQEYQKGLETMSSAIREHKETELQQLETRRNEFSQSAQRDYQQKQGELFQPIHNKAKEAVSKISKAGGYLAIFDTSAGNNTMAYIDESTVVDILPLVKADLGIIDAPAVAPAK